MDWLSIIFFIISILAIIAGLLLSGQGAGSGIAALSGQETELFRKTKDRGFFKQVQRFMFMLAILFVVVGIMLVALIDKYIVLGVAIALFIAMYTWSKLGTTEDKKINPTKAFIGLILGCGIGFIVYMLTIDTNRRTTASANDR